MQLHFQVSISVNILNHSYLCETVSLSFFCQNEIGKNAVSTLFFL